MSAMRSASSTTTVCTAPRSIAALRDEVLQTTGAGHHGVDPPSQGLTGRSVSRPAVDGDHAAAALSDSAASSRCTWAASSRVGTRINAPGRPGFDPEVRLTTAKPKANVFPDPVGVAAHVAPVERVGQRGCLDRERVGHAAGAQAGNQVGANPEIGE